MGLSPWGRQESDKTQGLCFHFSLHCVGEGNGNPLQCSCLENLRDRGASWAAVYGVAQSWTRLKRLSSSSSSSSSSSTLFLLTDTGSMGDSEDRLLSKCIPWASIAGPWAAVLVEEKWLRPVTLLSLFIRDICISVTSLFLGIWIPGPDWE